MNDLTIRFPSLSTSPRRLKAHKCSGYTCSLSQTASRGRRLCATAVETDYTVRLVAPQELWAVADVHVAAFYPNTFPLLYPFFKLDRVLSILEGHEHNAQKSGTRYACFVAKRSIGELPPVDGWMSVIWNAILPPEVCVGVGRSHVEMGIYGGLCMDTTGANIPSVRVVQDGRKRWCRQRGCAYLSNLAVSPHFRKQRVGRTLVEAAEHVARKWGCWSIALHCNQSNIAAIDLYTKLGYVLPETISTENFRNLSAGHTRFPNCKLMVKLL